MGKGRVWKKVAWVKWEEVCKEKGEGGLGIRGLLAFNRALLGKRIWRFLNESESLWVKVIKSRFEKLDWSRSGERRERGNREHRG